MNNISDNGEESGSSEDRNSSDWQQTIDESTAKSGTLKDTTSPGALNASGMPFPELLLNRQIGSGKIAGYIGSGGMGDVYKTWSEDLNRFHAVKLLKHGSNSQAEKRFEREIKVTATFDHPNIVRVHNAGRWKGYLFLEMEYIDGNGLDTLLQKMGPFPPAVCIAIGIMVTSALHYAHHHQYTVDGKTSPGVIHRDLKPSNIMLATDGRLKLMDFGIAKPIGAEFTSLTMGIVGSWIYLSPEQIDTSSVDHRSDIYTLGEVLYELLTGKPPFVFENQREFLNCKTKGKYPPIDSINGNVPQTLVEFVDKCMKVDPDRRFQTASEAGNALRALLPRLTSQSHEDVLASFISGDHIEQTRTQPPPPSKKRTPLIIGIISLFAVTGALLFYVFYFKDKITLADHTVPEMTAPVVVSPGVNRTLTDDTITIIWNSVPSAENYLVHISSVDSFSDTVFHSVLQDTVCQVAQFNDNVNYYWHVGTYGSNKTILWSPTGRFTKAEEPPAAPSLLNPTNKQYFSNKVVSFQWQSVPSGQSYHIQVSPDSTFSSVVIDSSGNTGTGITLRQFDPATTYYWRVKAEKKTIAGNWSKTCRFTMSAAPDSNTIVDYGAEAVAALKTKSASNVESILNKLSSADSRRDTLFMRLIEKYLSEGNTKKAARCFKSLSSKEMFSELLKGRMLLDDKNSTDAFTVLDAALHLETRFKAEQVIADVAWYKAIAATKNYDLEKSKNSRQTALETWHQVYKMYKGDKNHPRYKEALRESNRIAE